MVNFEKSLCGSEGRVHIPMEWLFYQSQLSHILVLDQSSTQELQKIRLGGNEEIGPVNCMTLCGDLLITAHQICLCVWNTISNHCERILEAGPKYCVLCVACGGKYLASGNLAGTIKIWEMGLAPWSCLGTISAHEGWVSSKVIWNGRVISGADACFRNNKSKLCMRNFLARPMELEATLDVDAGGGERWLHTGASFSVPSTIPRLAAGTDTRIIVA